MADIVSETAAGRPHRGRATTPPSRAGACGPTSAWPSGGRSSAATRPCAWSRSRCSPTVTSWSRTCRAPARRCSPARWPGRSRSTRRASRGRPTSSRPTSPAPACSSPAASASSPGPCSPTSCWSTRSTAPRRARSRRCWRRCRSTRSRSRGRRAACRIRSSCWRPRTRSSSRGRSPCRRRSWTGSCCAPGSATRTTTGSDGSPAATRTPPTRWTLIEPVVDRERLLAVRDRVRTVRVADEVEGYLVALVRATREHPDIDLGASPRATVALYRAAQAAAVLEGRAFVTPDDVKGIAPAVLAPSAGRRPRPDAPRRDGGLGAGRDPGHGRRPAGPRRLTRNGEPRDSRRR